MNLEMDMATRDAAGRAPWWDALTEADLERIKNKKQTQLRKSAAQLANEQRREDAIDAVRSLLADMDWHPKAKVREIAMSYDYVGTDCIIDHAGGYAEGDWVISARADL